MFNASLHVKDTVKNAAIIDATVSGPTLENAKVGERPGVYELTLSAPGEIKACAPGHSCNETYIYEQDEYTVKLEHI